MLARLALAASPDLRATRGQRVHRAAWALRACKAIRVGRVRMATRASKGQQVHRGLLVIAVSKVCAVTLVLWEQRVSVVQLARLAFLV